MVFKFLIISLLFPIVSCIELPPVFSSAQKQPIKAVETEKCLDTTLYHCQVLQSRSDNSKSDKTNIRLIRTRERENEMFLQTMFNTELSIQGDSDWHNPDQLAYAIGKITKEGISGLLKLCSAKTKFYQCLGTMYSSCINPVYFVSKGFTVDQSYQYVGIFSYVHFMCGGGLEVGIHNYGCIQHVYNNVDTKAALDNCTKHYNQTARLNPNSICCHSHNFLSCYENVFKESACGAQYPAVEWWSCESVRSALFLDFCDNPILHCPVGDKLPCPAGNE